MTGTDSATRCAWCGKPLIQVGLGRPRRFCGPAHRQRSYEARRQADAVGLGADAVIVSRDQVAHVQDRLWALRDALEIADDATAGRPTAKELTAVIEQVRAAAGDLDQLWIAPRD
ncbi:MAG TPA: hypothetical protein VHX59_15690 [Mycobacteriales bacterium]|nr:hypothetical protein [Mycobacteriales bacterium]